MRFEAAVSDPLDQIERIYGAVSWPFVEAARAGMESWLARDRSDERATHRYEPESFGLSRGKIRETFRDYTDRFLEDAQEMS